MLILSRKEGECIQIGDDVELQIIQTTRGYVKIGIQAPRSVLILRKELVKEVEESNTMAASTDSKDLADLSELGSKIKQ